MTCARTRARMTERVTARLGEVQAELVVPRIEEWQAAEYSCCSFASYHLTIDGDGVRMEVRTPPEARGALAAVFGTA